MREKMYTHCLFCGRALHSAECRVRGYGDVCFARMQSRKKNRLFMQKKVTLDEQVNQETSSGNQSEV